VIAVTAMAMPGDCDRCLEAGADDYLSKPLDLEQVIAQVRSFIETES
jgi:CheY-like chemotaxis protein